MTITAAATPTTTPTTNSPDAGTLLVITNNNAIQTTPQQSPTTSDVTAPNYAAGDTDASDQTSFSGGLITVNTTPAASSFVAAGAGTLSVRLSVDGADMGNMAVTDQGGTLTVSVASPSSGPASATSNTGGTSTGALTIYTVTNEGTKAYGDFAFNIGSGSVSLTQGTAPGGAAPITVSEGGRSVTFSITTADGVILEYNVSQSGNTLSIQPVNDAAVSATGAMDKKLITAIMLAAEDKLGTNIGQINAIFIHENK